MCFNRIHIHASKSIFMLAFLLVSTVLCYGNDLIITLEGHADVVLSVAYSPDGKTLASGAEDGTIKLWDVVTGQNIAILEGHVSSIINDVSSIAYSPDGKTLASGAWDNTIKLWNVATGRNVATLQGHTGWVTSIAYSPDGKTLASGSEEGAVKVWDVSKRKNIATPEGHKDAVLSIAYSPDGEILASGAGFIYQGQYKGKGTIKLWDVWTGQNVDTLEGGEHQHTGRVTSIAYSPDGKTLASGSSDNTIKLWNVLNK